MAEARRPLKCRRLKKWTYAPVARCWHSCHRFRRLRLRSQFRHVLPTGLRLTATVPSVALSASETVETYETARERPATLRDCSVSIGAQYSVGDEEPFSVPLQVSRGKDAVRTMSFGALQNCQRRLVSRLRSRVVLQASKEPGKTGVDGHCGCFTSALSR